MLTPDYFPHGGCSLPCVIRASFADALCSVDLRPAMKKGAPLRGAVLHPRQERAECLRQNAEHSVISLEFLWSEFFCGSETAPLFCA